MKSLKPDQKLVELCVNTIKLLAIEGVQKANSGHPGMPMGMADVAFVLWSQFLKFNPQVPTWLNRDRFVLSAGHGSMLLYSMLALTGYDLTLDDLKNFRQWESKTPGHPEFKCAPGVETTTGPLGQGFATGVGMAIAEKMMQARFNTPEHAIFDHKIFAIVSDGDLMEGVAAEAASLAGHLDLGNLIYIYDDNHITIEGNTALSFSENVDQRFQAYGWHTTTINGHDHPAIAAALKESIAETNRPSLIIARTHIAHGSPNFQDKAASHGAALGQAEIELIKQKMNWPVTESFHVPAEVTQFFNSVKDERLTDYQTWQEHFRAWSQNHPNLAKLLAEMQNKTLPEDLEPALMGVIDESAQATRAQSGKVIQKIAELLPGFCGGSADLAPSNNTLIKNARSISKADFSGRNLHFGIREHAMGAVLNGLALYDGCLLPYGGTFLVFSDYMRAAIRLAALMEQQVVYVFTHDSIFLGEDGPTHQSVEHYAALQLIPNLTVIRPADGAETAAAWIYALKNQTGPTALILSRQKLPPIHHPNHFDVGKVAHGGFILADSDKPDLILVASGSEVHLAMAAKNILEKEGHKIRVVSMPSLKLFKQQTQAYQQSVIPTTNCQVVAIEAGVTDLWPSVIGADNLVIGVDRFGASAPAEVLAEKFGFTAQHIANRVLEWLK